MAAPISGDSFNYTWDGQIAKELLYAPAVQAPDILRVFKVIQGIKSKYQLTLAPAISNLWRLRNGCTATDIDGITLENRTLTLCEMDFRMAECYDVFSQIWMEDDLGDGLSRFELSQKIVGYITPLLTDAMARDWFKIFSFGDTDSGSNQYNQCDGLFKKLIAGIATYDVTFVEQIQALNQVAGTSSYSYLKNLYEQCDILLKQVANEKKIFLMTGNVYENLVTYYEAGALTGGGLVERTENGVTTLRFRGIECQPVYAWDNALTDTNNPQYGDFKSVIIYTEKDNHVIGMGKASDNSAFTSWYERKDRKVYFEGACEIGYNYVHGDLTAISYGNGVS